MIVQIVSSALSFNDKLLSCGFESTARQYVVVPGINATFIQDLKVLVVILTTFVEVLNFQLI